MENKNTYFILQHNKNNKIFRASLQARQKKSQALKNFVATSLHREENMKKSNYYVIK